ncbi:MAG: hypothetical protein HY243_08720 [Proteobacteria bacterium]|nr:hypothetical protein [Pseudomonadota bacterium]
MLRVTRLASYLAVLAAVLLPLAAQAERRRPPHRLGERHVLAALNAGAPLPSLLRAPRVRHH